MPEIILELGAEGGSITIFGSQESGVGWSFYLQTYDCSDDDEDFKSTERHASSWPEAMDLLNTFSYWHLLHPMATHPEFRSRILDEVLIRGGDAAVNRWLERLNYQIKIDDGNQFHRPRKG